MDKPKLGILLGDACGIGPELIAKLCYEGNITHYCNPLIIGDIRVFKKAMLIIGHEIKVRVVRSLEDLDFTDPSIYNFCDQKDVDPEAITIGEVSAIAGKAAGDMLFKAMDLCKAGNIDGFAFAPLNKIALKLGGHKYESENKLFGKYLIDEDVTSEINVLGDLLTSRVTSHVPVSQISANITIDGIVKSIELIDKTLKFKGVEHPRIGVAALNPHCGEEGTCGREEIEIIEPAILKARELGMNVLGPNSSDILFIRAFRGDYDGVVTMYHDQGQIALKLKGFQYGVTFHGELPVAIATAAHGSAFDIAGKNIATTDAMENAIKLASEIASGLTKGR